MSARLFGLLSLLISLSACVSSHQPAPTFDDVVWDFCFDEAEDFCIRMDEQSTMTLDVPTSLSSTSYSLSGGPSIRFSGPFSSVDAESTAIFPDGDTVWRPQADLGYESSSLIPSDDDSENSSQEDARYKTRSELVEGQYFGLQVESNEALRYGWMHVTVRPRLAGFQVHDHYLGVEGEAVIVGIK